MEKKKKDLKFENLIDVFVPLMQKQIAEFIKGINVTELNKDISQYCSKNKLPKPRDNNKFSSDDKDHLFIELNNALQYFYSIPFELSSTDEKKLIKDLKKAFIDHKDELEDAGISINTKKNKMNETLNPDI